jgi:hypothetical protein
MRFFILFFLLFFVSFVHAEKLIVLTESDIRDVYVNGVFVGKGQVVEAVLDPGSYQVRVREGDTLIYQEMTQIDPSRNTTVQITPYVAEKSVLPDRISKQREAERVVRNLGVIGLGFHFGNVDSGLSLQWRPWPYIAIETTGWYQEGENYVKSFSLAGKYYISRTMSEGALLNLYVGGRWGAASVSEKSLYMFSRETYRHTISEAVFGMEVGAHALRDVSKNMSNSGGYLAIPGVFFSLLGALDNSVATFEIGLEKYQKNSESVTGITFNFANHWYF